MRRWFATAIQPSPCWTRWSPSTSRRWSRSSPRDFIDVFLIEMESEDAEARQFNARNLIIVSMDLFFAGMETSATMLHWSVQLMVMYPDVQTRLPYTEATLMEVSRRSSVLPQAVHSTTCDTTLAGYSIPKDTMVHMHMQEVHMDPEYWGDPEAFRPERKLSHDTAFGVVQTPKEFSVTFTKRDGSQSS
ncbi:Cytochrome P450 2J6 [Amphibalanus amphitrite]|uniref:Cytochrome P450 2J6 n=1 Tax=Amphibalanus amphitrite TaxID=1232801 RepID=A0A6A4VKU8_AMPAM|nr:Cytochrome P450 2J6 [Amphibalanus amphitrite]